MRVHFPPALSLISSGKDVIAFDTEDSDDSAADQYKSSLRERTKRQIARNRAQRLSPVQSVTEYNDDIGDEEMLITAAKIQLLENERNELKRTILKQQENPENVVPIEFVTKLNKAKSEVAMLKKELEEKQRAHLLSEQTLREQLVQVQRDSQNRELHFGHQLEELNNNVKELQSSVETEKSRNETLSYEHSAKIEEILNKHRATHKAANDKLTKQLQDTIKAERETREALERAHRLEMEKAKEELRKAKELLEHDHIAQLEAIESADQNLRNAAMEKLRKRKKLEDERKRLEASKALSAEHFAKEWGRY